MTNRKDADLDALSAHLDSSDASLDALIRDAWQDVRVDASLEASALAAIQKARSSESSSSPRPQGASESPSPAREHAPEKENTPGGVNAPVFIPVAPTGKRPRRIRFARAAVAAVLCLALVGIGGGVIYNTETAYASIGAQQNASVTLGVNRFGYVRSVQAADNGSGVNVNDLGLKGMSYEDAMETLLESGYFTDDQVDASISSDDASQQDGLVSTTQACLTEAGCSGSCNGQSYGNGHAYGSANGKNSDTNTGSGQGSGSNSGMGQQRGQAHHAESDE